MRSAIVLARDRLIPDDPQPGQVGDHIFDLLNGRAMDIERIVP
jgi:hypothetical protein